jgi:hypothetical protein
MPPFSYAENAHNGARLVDQAKAVGFSAVMPRYRNVRILSGGCNCVLCIREDRCFSLDANAEPQPIDCEHPAF